MKNLTFTNKIAVAALVLATMGVFLFATGIVYATPYGTEITIYDGVGTNGLGTLKEDNEAEPGMVQSQAWDLEGFFLKGNDLTIIGGYNFYTGENDGHGHSMKAGDIFIDTDDDAVYSPNTIPGFTYTPYQIVRNYYFKYDYVLDINWTGGTYDIIQLNELDNCDGSKLKDTSYGADYNMPSNPWIYYSKGIKINTSPLDFNNYGKASKGDTGFSGWNGNNKHYVATFDISAISSSLSNGAVFHNTMECGNDNLLGRSAPVPEPSTLILIVTGLLGVGVVRRRIRK